MTIKKKDGTIFKLDSPNPVMKHQNFNENFILHNFNEPDEEIIINQKWSDPLEELWEISEKKDQIEKSKLYCLPMINEKIIDSVYGEERIKSRYGQQFVLFADVLNNDGLSITFYCSQQLNVNSILFEPSNRSWWKVSEEIGEFTYKCFPSSVQPSFNVEDN